MLKVISRFNITSVSFYDFITGSNIDAGYKPWLYKNCLSQWLAAHEFFAGSNAGNKINLLCLQFVFSAYFHCYVAACYLLSVIF
jgi:hypothetical protein